MLNENMKALRKNKGLTQEELANRLNVVRQTVSKWEKGLSVPDAEMLQKIADVLESDVSQLLGAPIQQNDNTDVIAEQLSRINEQLAVKNNRSRKIWKAVGIILAIIIAGQMLLVALGVTAFKSYEVNTDTYEEYVEEIVDD
ncbi:MAG: helix-turn-helix transcriptional regulator [Firmicutes bacterium]|nr:helix-turn-helix transcriptional regulator [Bacillota bacterium]